MTPICSMSDVLTYVKNFAELTDEDVGFLNFVRPLVEARVRAYLGYPVTQATVTEFLPSAPAAGRGVLDIADFAYPDEQLVADPSVLTLGSVPVTAVAEVRVNAAGMGVAANFTDRTILDPSYYDYGPSGLLSLRSGAWPVYPGSVMVTYTAGLSDADLADGSGDIRLAAVEAVAENFRRNKGRNKSMGGVMVSERYPDYSAAYQNDPTKVAAVDVFLPDHVKKALDPHRRYRLF